MSGTNHVAGGTVFTAIFTSFWNINIFNKPELIALTAFFAILPDIDHLKSPIGKLFYPIAKWLDRKYGHRTITHSLLCYFLLLLFIAFIERILGSDFTITLIFSFSYISHLIFDMMTKQGVPLYYPFKRNACVIPGNPDLRFKSSDIKTEASIFLVFLLIGLTCQPLFANGFWTSYNRQFGTLKHVFSEFRNSDKFIKVDYEFTCDGNVHQGSGIVATAKTSEAVIFNQGFELIKDDYKITKLLPEKTTRPYQVEELFFYDIKQDSLFKLLRNKAILTLKIQSTSKISYVKDNKPTIGKSIDLDYQFNPKLLFVDDSLTSDLFKQLELLNYELQKLQKEESVYVSSRREVDSRINEITTAFNQMDIYNREKATIELRELNKKKESFKDYVDDRGKILLKIKHLNKEIERTKLSSCSGYISFLNL